MAIQNEVYSRDVFLSVFKIDTNAWTQRGYRDEVALAFGLSRPAHTNEYGEVDLFATELTILIANFIKIDMKRAAGLVRDYWREILDGLAKAERVKGRAVYSEGIRFVVASNPDKTRIDVAVGPYEETINKSGLRRGALCISA